MRPFLPGAVLVATWGVFAPAQAMDPTAASSTAPTCDTMYIGPPDGASWVQANWTNGIPHPGRVPCFPDYVDRADGTQQELPTSGPITRPSNPPPPTATGSCCLASTCVQTDYFDCRQLAGYFLEGVGPCNEFLCASGVCCVGDPPACIGDDGGGGGMDESLCAILSGNYLGGAVCDATEPCQRFRIPEGFEVIDVISDDILFHPPPRLNNCGEIVFTYDFAWIETGEIRLYDNGLIARVTDNAIPDGGPDINDRGTIVWYQDDDQTGHPSSSCAILDYR